MFNNRYSKNWKVFWMIIATIVFLTLPYFLKMNIFNYLLVELAISLLLCMIWRLWWLWPIYSCFSMVIYLVVISDWSPFKPHPEGLYAWLLCIEAFFAGLFGSIVGYLISKLYFFIIVLKKGYKTKEY